MTDNTSKNSMEIMLRALRDDYLADLPARFQEMETEILALEEHVLYKENFESLFRNVHSIKGSAGTHGLFILTRICHRLEDYLTSHKQNSVLNHSEVSHLLKFIDLLAATRDLILNGVETFTEVEKKLEDLDVQLFKGIFKILIVGESATNINIITQLLEEYPVKIVTSLDGLQSLEKLVHDKFDMMIVAMELTILNGLAVIAATRLSKSINSKLPIILLTSKEDIILEPSMSVNYVIQRDSKLIDNMASAFKNLLTNN